ncbi:uncharacterized protein MONBRDRAFT_22818 [Monosiga brevicollis MX1]|uniref:Peptidase A2 domain-containing protein n=1 Tax=Monosiga brevicollis TaxID=81824 RepID=A9US63_MONBE|nr:uncharacterized protein MONBRDRAFT_22818 [Monosiga brevicollis MX1]EDQ91725.1 predicted protein [Monosiga brevicollis MX1]|eukprot:XP_001743011.1 hypothetical protein [Monosiga brevicollis MX1]
MDRDGLVVLGDVANHYEVDAMPHKRMLAFVNHFVTSTASFLNHFSVACEKKLHTVSDRLAKLEVTVALLENKLQSIEGLDGVTGEQYVSTTQTPAAPAASAPSASAAPAPTESNNAPVAPAPDAAPNAAPAAPEAEPETPRMTNRDDPRYKKYFKMMDMGVPLPAVQTKFALETGADPSILENPDAPVGNAGGADDDSASEASDFSDNEDEADDFSD